MGSESSTVSNSIDGVHNRLTPERWSHIIARHPEIELYRSRILETISNPDFVAKGDHGEFKAVKLYSDFPIGARYLIVMYREVRADDGTIITARINSDMGNLLRGGIIWQKK